MKKYVIGQDLPNPALPSAAAAVPGPMGLPILTLTVNIEKVPGGGEDAEPLIRVGQSGSVWFGVCDGLGGAGNKRYPVGDKHWTGARIASITTMSTIGKWIDCIGQYIMPSQSGGVLSELDEQIRRAIKEMEGRFSESGPVITGTVIRALPTTLALGLVEPIGPQHGRFRVFWAGDSRVYLLSPIHGLMALTSDHVHGADMNANRSSDSPMANMISASSPFYIEERAYQGPFPVIAFAASDGCFGYFRSPARFEQMLLTTLASSASMEEWERAMTTELDKVASDDCTMGVATIGWPTFDEIKASFQKRLAYVEELAVDIDRFDEDIRARRAVINANQAEIDRLEEDKRERLDEQWAAYSMDYIISAEGRKSR